MDVGCQLARYKAPVAIIMTKQGTAFQSSKIKIKNSADWNGNFFGCSDFNPENRAH